jgi:hypothetical protein
LEPNEPVCRTHRVHSADSPHEWHKSRIAQDDYSGSSLDDATGYMLKNPLLTERTAIPATAPVQSRTPANREVARRDRQPSPRSVIHIRFRGCRFRFCDRSVVGAKAKRLAWILGPLDRSILGLAKQEDRSTATNYRPMILATQADRMAENGLHSSERIRLIPSPPRFHCIPIAGCHSLYRRSVV